MEEQKKQQSKTLPHKHLKECKIKLDLTKKLGLNIPKEDKYIIPIFIPHRGCKNECVFCNQKRISGEIRQVTPDDVRTEIENWIANFKNKTKVRQIAFFGGSFTGLDFTEQEAFLKVANEFITKGLVQSIKLSTRPDYIDDEVLKLLKKYNVKCIELGVQSMDDKVLEASKRGHTAFDVKKASRLIKKYGFELGHQVMVGLPKSTLDKEIYTMKECLKLKPNVVRIYPVYVLKESKLYDMAKSKEYVPLKLEEAILRAKEMYELCVKKKVKVIRIGLQTTEEINEKAENILGPVCDNYKEKILTCIAKVEIQKRIKKLNSCDKLTLIVPASNVNYIVGNKKENIKEMENLTKAIVKIKCNKE